MEPFTQIPATITAGDSLALRLSLSAYPATAGWSLAWILNGPTNQAVEFAPDGEAFAATIPADSTSTWDAGTYRWLLRASQGATTITVQSGGLDVQPDLATALPGASASWEERTLVVVEAALSGTLEGGMKLYMIAGRQVQTLSVGELTKLRAELRATIQMQRGEGFGVPVRFDVVGLR